MFPLDDTIVAIATAARGAERGIIRLSGPDAVGYAAHFFSSPNPSWRAQPQAQVVGGSLRLDAFREMPCELYVWPTIRSYTRQPVAEIHTIGSRPLLERVVVHLCQAGARLANPGEFTLRAFLAGRLDLPQAEAVLGVIDSESESQFQVAVGQLAGGLSGRLNVLRSDLLDLCADLEAGLDFVEEDIEFVSNATVIARLQQARAIVEELQQRMQTRATEIAVPQVVVTGLPNAGKSSLINAICGGKVAIVSSRPGTTRDYVSRTIEIQGLKCELMDTAGQEPVTGDGPDALAQGMAARSCDQAHFRLICVDSSREMLPAEMERLRHQRNDRDLWVATKSDLKTCRPQVAVDVCTSARTGEGIDDLKQELANRLEHDSSCAGETVSATAIRCHDSLQKCRESLRRAEDLADARCGDELTSAELRMALDSLGQIVGAVYTDDVLDRVFSRFCIGK